MNQLHFFATDMEVSDNSNLAISHHGTFFYKIIEVWALVIQLEKF